MFKFSYNPEDLLATLVSLPRLLTTGEMGNPTHRPVHCSPHCGTTPLHPIYLPSCRVTLFNSMEVLSKMMYALWKEGRDEKGHEEQIMRWDVYCDHLFLVTAVFLAITRVTSSCILPSGR